MPATHYYDGAERHNVVTIDGKHYLLAAPPDYNNMASLGGKVTFGDYTRDSDENSSSKIWVDFSGGIGIENIREGSDDGAYWYGYVNARNPFQLALGRETLEFTNVKFPLGNFKGSFYASDGTNFFTWDEATLAFIDTGFTVGAEPYRGRCATFNETFFVPCGAAGVVAFSGVGNGTLDASVKAIDLMEFDNHLYAITTDKQLYQYDGSAWGSLETFLWGDEPRGLAIYMNRLEDDILYIATSRGLIAWDKTNSAGYRTRFQPPIAYDNGLGLAPWRAGENLYYSSGMQVYQYNVSAAIPVGPAGREGVPASVRGRIVDLEPSFNSLFALIEGQTETAPPATHVAVDLSNPSFESDASGWTVSYEDADWTATFAFDGTEDADGVGGSGKYDLTVNTGAQNDSATIVHDAVTVTVGVEYGLTVSVKSSDADLVPVPVINWYDASDSYLSNDAGAGWVPTPGAWAEQTVTATAPAGAVYARFGVSIEDVNVAGGTTGSVWIDGVEPVRPSNGAYLEGGLYFDDPLEMESLSSTALATVMEYTGSGWHPCWESPGRVGTPWRIVRSSELDHERVFWGYGDAVYSQKLSKTSSLIRQQWEAREARFAPSGYLDTGWFDGNMRSFPKLADRLEVNVTNVTASSWFAIDYRIDNETNWSALTGPITHVEGDTKGRVIIPFGVENVSIDGVLAKFSRGTAFDRIRFRVRFETSDPEDSAIIDSIVLKYLKQAQPYPLFGLAIDVSTRAEELFGRTASEIRKDLTELTTAKQFVWMRLGDFNNPVMRVLITAERGIDGTGNDQSAVRRISVVGYPLPGYEGLPPNYDYEP